MPTSLASIARSRATTGIMTLSDSTLSEIITWMASMLATGTKARFIVLLPPLRGVREGEVAPSYGDGGVMSCDMAMTVP